MMKMKSESGNTKCYAVELCEKWEICNKVMSKTNDRQIINSINFPSIPGNPSLTSKKPRHSCRGSLILY